MTVPLPDLPSFLSGVVVGLLVSVVARLFRFFQRPWNTRRPRQWDAWSGD